MAEEAAKDIKAGADGIILTHGTDTLHYSAAALSFMLRTPVPIVFVGSQRSSDRGSSDNVVNFLFIIRLRIYIFQINIRIENSEKL